MWVENHFDLSFWKWIQILDPLELPITKREHFNRWYSTGAYYLALFISDVPVIITCCTLYLFLINFLTDQPMDTFRFSNFVFIGTLTSFTAQSFGMFIGSMFDVKVIERLSKLRKSQMFLKPRCFVLQMQFDYFKCWGLTCWPWAVVRIGRSGNCYFGRSINASGLPLESNQGRAIENSRNF